MSKYFHSDDDFRFLFPIDGDCLNGADLRTVNGTHTVRVTLAAPAGGSVTVCGVPAVEADGVYTADVPVPYRRNVLCAADAEGRTRTVTIYRLPRTEGYYRLSSDDNILFLQDINDHRDEYTSIFDNPYLNMYRRAHDLYGARVHLNLFYETDGKALSKFSGDRKYFNLSMMTDKFKEEFAACSDWLKLAFHSRSEYPDRPYKDAPAEQITEDCTAVLREILRFAGPGSVSDATTVHWGEANHDCTRALRALGFRGLTGYFEHGSHGQPLVAYYAPDDLIDHVGARDFWYDAEEDMFFGRIDLVLNMRTNEINLAMLREIADDPHRGGFVSIMIHEQYFHPDYIRYLPDFADRVLDACRLLHDRGYRGSHITDVISEPHLNENPLFNAGN